MIFSHLFFLALIVASPSNGAAKTNTAPPIPTAMVAEAILSDLVYSTPHLEIDLDEATPSAAIENLVRAKLLRVTGKTDGYAMLPQGRLILMLTAKGEKTALERGWAYGGGVLQIPTGRLSWVGPSYSIQQDKKRTYLTYLWRFEGNANLTYLLRLGAPSTWPASMFTSCFLGNRFGPVPPQRRTIEIYRNAFGTWSTFEIYPIKGCVTEK